LNKLNKVFSFPWNFSKIIFQLKLDFNSQSNFDVHQWIEKKLPNGISLPESLAS